MYSQNFRQLLRSTADDANQKHPREVGTLAHLLIHCLKQNDRYHSEPKRESSPVSLVIRDLELEIEKYAIAPNPSTQDSFLISYDIERAVESYERFSSQYTQQEKLTDSAIRWLLKGEFSDNFLKLCRKTCRQRGVDPLFLLSGQQNTKVVNLGFGLPIDAQWLEMQSNFSFLGRQAEIDKHHGFLSLAIRQRRHYLLEGHRGVGKSTFLRELIKTSVERWQSSGDRLLSGLQFILLDQKDFIYSEEDNRTRLTRLYQYLQLNPQVVPVFDNCEGLLNPSLSVHEIFTSLFGSIFSTSGRTFILVCRSEVASSSSLLEHVKGYTLSPLSPTVCSDVAAERLESLASQYGINCLFDTSKREFCSLLINTASERYPNRFFPEIALHLVESTLNRAVNRILYLKQPPLDKILTSDLWEHVAEEQSISTETIGKDPDDFYQNVQSTLKQQVIGQDSAVEKVCKVLQTMAKRPPRKAPRGRFLFVGPPGVGKTHLGRQLAIHLGLGDEAFFIFNMSEYSSESARTRFMGADPGYVGYRSTKTIYDLVRSRPSCVILLDEIDRADASIQDILLSILEGEGKDAEGKIVYFSQVVFIMTTNQGQDQVEAVYHQTSKADSHSRSELSDQFGDESLRKLIIQGALDETEAAMQEFLRLKVNDAKHQFDECVLQQALVSQSGEEIVEKYIALKTVYSRLKQAQPKTPLDRALLDRVDFVIPFFPVKEPEYLMRILDLTLERYDWLDCSQATKNEILSHSLEQKESVRCLERLVMKHLSEV